VSLYNPQITSYRDAFLLDASYAREVTNDFPDRPNSYGTVGTYGWLAHGNTSTPTNLSSVERIDFANDTLTASSRGPTSTAYSSGAGVSNTAYGWITGQTPGTPLPNSQTLIDRIDFSNDVTGLSGTRSYLTVGRSQHQGVGTLNYGWWGQAITYFAPGSAPFASYIERLDYANDLSICVIKGTTTQTRVGYGATGNSAFAWWAGGGNGGIGTYIDRTDFANDLNQLSIRGQFSISKYWFSSTGNASYGWYGGGNGPYSSVDRIDYSNDLVASVVRGPLSLARYALHGIGNSGFGWQAGGAAPPSYYTTVDRIDYSNDTATANVRGSLLNAKSFGSSVSNYVIKAPPTVYSLTYANYGWNAGGPLSSIDRIDFSNDSATATARGPLSVQRGSVAGVGNANYGWFGGGYVPGPANSSSIDRVDYANDSLTGIVRGLLTTTLAQGSAVGNANYGWFGLAFAPGGSPVRLDYSNDSVAIKRGSLNIGGLRGAAVGNADYGWFGGGYNGGTIFSLIDRVDYANDNVTASARGTMSNRSRHTGFGNGNYGWMVGGTSGSFQPYPMLSSVERIDYSNDTVSASARTALPATNQRMAGTGNSNYGWTTGGAGSTNAPAISTVYRVDYANDLSAGSSRGPLSAAKYTHSAVANYVTPGLNSLATSQPFTGSLVGGNRGWVAGGKGQVPAGWAIVSTINRLDISNDTNKDLASALTSARYKQGALGNANYGWQIGGSTTDVYTPYTPLSTVDRIDYSNDLTVLTRTPFIRSAMGLVVTGNANYGWNGATGDLYSPTTSYLDRIDYANDISINRGVLTTIRSSGASSGNANYGWFTHGYQPSPVANFSSVERLTYASDTSTVSRGPMNVGKYQSFSSANNSYIWFAGGNDVTATSTSSVDRVDTANDTITASARGALINPMFAAASIGTKDYAWFAGGNTVPTGWSYGYSYITRVDYANDTVVSSARGLLPTNRYSAGGSSNYQQPIIPIATSVQFYKSSTNVGTGAGTYGWNIGGYSSYVGPVPMITLIDRIDFSSDTSISVTRGNMSIARRNLAGVNTGNYGWAIAGNDQPGGGLSTIDRLDYSNDLTTMLSRGKHITSEGNIFAISNNQYGWIIGGGGGTVSRLDFVNDNVNVIARASLPAIHIAGRAVGNQNFGWVAGGQSPAGYITTISRITYSNDLTTPSIRGSLSGPARYGGASAGNANYGWIMAGRIGSPIYLDVDRIDYSNDTSNAGIRSPLTGGYYYLSATGNANFAYVTGGFAGYTNVQRVSYANDTVSPIAAGSMNTPRGTHVSISNYAK
jgi:hypothetical protein